MLSFVYAEIFPSLVFLIPAFVLLHIVYFRNLRESSLCFLFSFYICAVYAFVGLPNVTYIRFEVAGNMIPFAGILADLKNSVLNILLFVPLGIALPLLNQRYRRMQRTLLFGFCVSLVIELLQIFTYRSTDINDLITNTVGTVLGFLFSGIVMKTMPPVRAISRRKNNVLFSFLLSFGGMFFLQPFLVALR